MHRATLIAALVAVTGAALPAARAQDQDPADRADPADPDPADPADPDPIDPVAEADAQPVENDAPGRDELDVDAAFDAALRPSPPGTADTSSDDDAPTVSETPTEPAEPVADQELGARIGLEMSTDYTPGGLLLGGEYLYRMTDRLWFDSGVDLTIGGRDAGCFRDRDDEVVCDHAMLEGVGARASAGVRIFLSENQGFVPYVVGRAGIGLISFGEDEVRGISIPVAAGAGVRARVTDQIALTGGATLRGGPAWLNRGIGLQLQGSLTVYLGVDFRL